MAEQEHRKTGRRATAMLAGSALALSSFAAGIPAAFADEEDPRDQATNTQAPDEEASESPTPEETPSDNGDNEPSEEPAPSPEPSDASTENESPAEPTDEPTEQSPRSLSNTDGEGNGDEDEDEVEDEAEADVDPSVNVNPGAGPAGTTVTVNGSSFSPGGQVELTMSPEAGGSEYDLGSLTATESGFLDTSELQIPENAENGVYSIRALDVESGENTSVDFNVTNATLTIDPESIPDEDFVDAGVRLTVDELAEGTEVEFTFGNYASPMPDLAGTATANADGVAEYTVQGDEESVFVGDYSVWVAMVDGPQVASGSFEVTSELPQVFLHEDEVEAGGELTVSASNLQPGADITFEWGPGGQTEQIEAPEYGRIDAQLDIPVDTELGDKELTVTDGETGESVTLRFTVVDGDDEGSDPEIDPQISLDRTEAYAGQLVQVTGSGFTEDGQVQLSLGDQMTEVDANDEGAIATPLRVPGDLGAGPHDLTALDVESTQQSTVELTVLEVTEPTLDIHPDRIELDDFIRDSEDEDDDSGVLHTVVGLEPGEQVDVVVEGPEGVATVERVEDADDNGVADFYIYGFDIANPENYLGEYHTSVTLEDHDEASPEGSFEVIVDGDDEGSDPEFEGEIDLSADEAYPGDTISVDGTGFTPQGSVEFSLNPDLGDTTANADGAFSTEITIPEDVDPDEYEFVARDVDADESVAQAFTVLDPADQVADASLTVDPQEITVADFIDEEAGVMHTVEDANPSSTLSYVVSGPENVNDFESTESIQEDGSANFVIHGYDVANPAVYVGDYTTVVTFEDENGQQVELEGHFSVVDPSGATDGGETSAEPVDMNGTSGLARTGASNMQLGLLAGLLLTAGGAFVVYSNRARLFPNKK